MKVLQDGNKRMKKLIQQRNSIRMSVNFENVNFSKEQLAMIEEREQVIGDLQFSLDERGAQLEEVGHHPHTLTTLTHANPITTLTQANSITILTHANPMILPLI